MDELPPSIERDEIEGILSHLFAGVIIVNGSGQVVWINPAAEAVARVRGDGVCGRPACEVFDQLKLGEISSRAAPAVPGGDSSQLVNGQPFDLQIIPLSSGWAAVILHEKTASWVIDQSKKEHALFIAHELRSPLTAIQGYAELIPLAGPVTSKQEEFIRQIQAGVRKINDLFGEISGNIVAKT